MNIDVTLLSDNIANRRGLLAEHGLSILLEKDARHILFDVGQGSSTLQNAQALGVTLRFAPIILSHGHYDHTGGLRSLLRAFQRHTVFAHPAIFRQRFSTKAETYARDVGVPFTREELEKEGAEFRSYDRPHEVLEGVWITGQIPRPFAANQAVRGLSLDVAGCIIDDVPDEIAVVVEGSKRTLLLLGCAHAGVRNVIQQVETMTDKPLYAIVGGLHLIDSSPAEVKSLALFLHERGVEFVAASHCTGCKAAEVISKYVECAQTAVGTHLRFEL